MQTRVGTPAHLPPCLRGIYPKSGGKEYEGRLVHISPEGILQIPPQGWVVPKGYQLPTSPA